MKGVQQSLLHRKAPDMRSVPSSSASPSDTFASIAADFSLEALSSGHVPAVARRALADGGALQGRACRLAPLFVLWFCIARHLFCQDSVRALYQRLVHALRGRLPGLPLDGATDGGLCRARRRLGITPLRLFLRGLDEEGPPTPRFHGLRVLAIDGAWFSTPDTEDNRTAFGRTGGHRGLAAWPQVAVVMLLDVEHRWALDARVGPARSAEKVLVRDLLDSVGEGDLMLLDMGYYGVPVFLAVEERGAHFLLPVPRHVRFRSRGPVTRRGNVLEYSARIRSRIPLPDGRTRTLYTHVRVIEIQRPGFRPARYVTSLLDVPAEELVALYPKRWAIEEAFDEIKTVLCHRPAGAPRSKLRSKTPEGVVQEVFALLCAHALIRITMARAAEEGGLAPTELGFTQALHTILCTATTMLGAPAELLPRLHQQMLEDLLLARLRRPEKPRSYPRVIKRIPAKYPNKKVAA